MSIPASHSDFNTSGTRPEGLAAFLFFTLVMDLLTMFFLIIWGTLKLYLFDTNHFSPI